MIATSLHFCLYSVQIWEKDTPHYLCFIDRRAPIEEYVIIRSPMVDVNSFLKSQTCEITLYYSTSQLYIVIQFLG